MPKEIEWLTDNGSCYITSETITSETRQFAKSLGFMVFTTPVTRPKSNDLGGGSGGERAALAIEVLKSSDFIGHIIQKHDLLVPVIAAEC